MRRGSGKQRLVEGIRLTWPDIDTMDFERYDS